MLGGEDSLGDALLDDLGEDRGENTDALHQGQDVELRIAGGVELLGQPPLRLLHAGGGGDGQELVRDRASVSAMARAFSAICAVVREMRPRRISSLEAKW